MVQSRPRLSVIVASTVIVHYLEDKNKQRCGGYLQFEDVFLLNKRRGKSEQRWCISPKQLVLLEIGLEIIRSIIQYKLNFVTKGPMLFPFKPSQQQLARLRQPANYFVQYLDEFFSSFNFSVLLG